jgi:hypothetical protein
MTYTVGKYELVSPECVTDEIILEGFRSLHQAMAEGFDAMRRDMNQRFAESEQRVMRHFDERDDRLDDHARRITALEATH